MAKVHISPKIVTIVASHKVWAVDPAALYTLGKVIPPSTTLWVICIAKSMPTPTTIDPIITVIKLNDWPKPTIVNGSNITTQTTGNEVTSPTFQFLKVTLRTVNTKIKQIASVFNWDEISCALTRVPIAATPVNTETCTFPCGYFFIISSKVKKYIEKNPAIKTAQEEQKKIAQIEKSIPRKLLKGITEITIENKTLKRKTRRRRKKKTRKRRKRRRKTRKR